MKRQPAISVLDVADDDWEMLEYVESLFASHVWGDRLGPLRDYVRVVMNPGSTLPGGRPYPLALSASKRRLLVAMTWPEPLGKPAVPARALHRGLKAGAAVSQGGPLWHRTYNDISDHVRYNLRAVIDAASAEGYPGDVLRDAAEVGLIPDIDTAIARLLVDDPDPGAYGPRSYSGIEREWFHGYLVNWGDLLKIAGALRLRFEPTEAVPSGAFGIDLDGLVAGIRRHEAAMNIKEDFTRQAETQLARLDMLEGGPTELHKLVSARGLITPPDLGTKYHALFQYLDAQNDMTTIDRGRLEQLVEVSDPKAKRPVRGAKGSPGLPRLARTTTRFWHSRWDPNRPNWALIEDETLRQWLGNNPAHRAWLSCGMTAKPIIEKGNLTSVRFIPMEDRHAWEHWRCWRVALRAGSFRSVAVLSRP